MEDMEKWITDMISFSEKHVPNYRPGDLVNDSSSDGLVIAYSPEYDSNEISLEGDFTIKQLEALTEHMKKYQGENDQI